ncbi:MAG: leucyl/phenylalanyl-tRNA--protein transferase [Saprospiraceae bacterium]|nr:leucyl/phenylalanyl-tRNA--protein transferase [Bacteroidia bacterium]NNE14855.1 leucyl/phenylalanyl-tRNA--protein transferase [Saprospiraceae bacterium]NNL91897.1 leucyl/phenylalanyl-tRNA--protein transferase [Saprospiraceae bacterium]
MAFLLPDKVDYFPHPLLSDEDGFLAISSDISVSKVLLAYQFGIFPWYNQEDPILWWFTNPRFVLFPDRLKISKSMRSYLNQDKFQYTFDTAFTKVMQACRHVKRKGQEDTWITNRLEEVFTELHNQGYAHSVEVWENEKLIGGLYGISLGKVFYGESMFSLKSNASKFGMIKLVQWLDKKGFELIDCQQETKHLASLGAELIDGNTFFNYLKSNIFNTTLKGKWQK